MRSNFSQHDNDMKRQLQEKFPKKPHYYFMLIGLPLLMWVSLVSFFAGLFMPIVTVHTVWIFKNSISVMGALGTLFQEHNFGIFIIVLFFSVFFPLLKLFFMLFTWYVGDLTHPRAIKLLHWMSMLGKWSMLDVFVMAIFVVIAKLGILSQAKIEPGLYFFAGSILLALFTGIQMHKLANEAKQ
jgi:paraquat-inducible protein A